jgi:hypothetical protein
VPPVVDRAIKNQFVTTTSLLHEQILTYGFLAIHCCPRRQTHMLFFTTNDFYQLLQIVPWLKFIINIDVFYCWRFSFPVDRTHGRTVFLVSIRPQHILAILRERITIQLMIIVAWMHNGTF